MKRSVLYAVSGGSYNMRHIVSNVFVTHVLGFDAKPGSSVDDVCGCKQEVACSYLSPAGPAVFEFR